MQKAVAPVMVEGISVKKELLSCKATLQQIPVTHILWHRLPGAQGHGLACGLAVNPG
jgi:hypothetical protein